MIVGSTLESRSNLIAIRSLSMTRAVDDIVGTGGEQLSSAVLFDSAGETLLRFVWLEEGLILEEHRGIRSGCACSSLLLKIWVENEFLVYYVN